MDAPSGLEAAGKAAFAHAVETIEAGGFDASLYFDPIATYARASDVAAVLRRGWSARGCPVLSVGSSKQPVEHPLIGALRDQERHVERLAESLLLTPKSRRAAGGAGWRKGSARSADRRPLRAVD